MKKTSMLLMAACLTASAVEARTTVVTTVDELTQAWTNAVGNDTIAVAPGYYNHNGKLKFPATAKIVVQAQYNHADSIPTLQGSIEYQSGSVINNSAVEFHNLKMKHLREGARHIIYLKEYNDNGNIERVVFRNCELFDSARGAFRTTDRKSVV